MRTFVILLVMANLVYLGWNLAMREASPRVTPLRPVTKAESSLQLVTELALPQNPQVDPQSCISLGVFNNTGESDFLVSALIERGIQARAELVEIGQNRSFRVFMPPFNSPAAARQTLGTLHADGIDSFIITTGNLSGGISLGVFRQQSLALALQERLAGEGYATSIEEVVTTGNEIWVTIQGLSQALLEGSELLDLLTEGLALEVVEKPCEIIASGP
jgi:hypothetical protein